MPENLYWKLYALKNLTNIPVLKGSIIHDTLQKSIEFYRVNNKVCLIDKPVEYFRKKFRESYNESFNYYNSGGNAFGKKLSEITRLSEHEFGGDNTVEEAKKAEETGVKSLESLWKTDLWNSIFSIDPKDIYAVDPGNFPYFQWEVDNFPENMKEYKKFKIYSVIDLAIKKNNRLHIIDWKTGKEDSGNPLQLAIYALYANDIWDIEISDIDLSFCYLGEEFSEKPVKITLPFIKSSLNTIMVSYRKIAELFNNGEPDIESFEKCSSEPDVCCRHCNFRKICWPADF